VSYNFRIDNPQEPGWINSASFITISIILHLVLVLVFIGHYGYGSAPLKLTEVTLLAAGSPNPQEIKAKTPPKIAEQKPDAIPEKMPAPPVQHKPAAEKPLAPPPAPTPKPEAPLEETQAPLETAKAEPQPEPQDVPPADAGTTAQADQSDAGQPPVEGNPLALFCTHPRIPLPDEEDAVDYDSLGYPEGYEQKPYALGHYAYFGQAGGPTIRSFARPADPFAGTGNTPPAGDVLVVLAIRLNSFGMVTGIAVLESGGRFYDAAAADAAQRSVFGPAVIDGRPVDCIALLPVRFSQTSAKR
jgi:periplasmic protein TonB